MFVGPVLLAAFDAGVVVDAEAGDGGSAVGAEAAAADATVHADAEGDAAAAVDVGADADGGDDGRVEEVGAVVVDAGAPDGADDAGAEAGAWGPSLSFGALTGDVALPMAGTFDIALVEVGAVACRSPKLVAPVTLAPGQLSTVAILGLATADAGSDSALSIVAFADESATDSGETRVRIVNAALGWPGGAGPATPLAVSIGGESIAGEVDPKHATSLSMLPSVDPLGYATVAAVTPPSALRLDSLGDAAQQSWMTDPEDFGLSAGTVHSGFVVDRSASSLGVVWCKGASVMATTAFCDVYDAPAQ
jgi:hypothetical protein